MQKENDRAPLNNYNLIGHSLIFAVHFLYPRMINIKEAKVNLQVWNSTPPNGEDCIILTCYFLQTLPKTLKKKEGEQLV